MPPLQKCSGGFLRSRLPLGEEAVSRRLTDEEADHTRTVRKSPPHPPYIRSAPSPKGEGFQYLVPQRDCRTNSSPSRVNSKPTGLP